MNFKFQLQNFHSVLVHEQFKIVLIRWVLFLCSVPFTSDCFAADWNFIHKCEGIFRYVCVCLWGVCHNMPVSKSKSKLQWKIWQAIYRFAKWQKPLMNVSFSQSTDSRSKASDDVYLNLDFSTRIRIQIQIGTAARWCPFESCTRHSWVNIIKHTHTLFRQASKEPEPIALKGEVGIWSSAVSWLVSIAEHRLIIKVYTVRKERVTMKRKSFRWRKCFIP